MRACTAVLLSHLDGAVDGEQDATKSPQEWKEQPQVTPAWPPQAEGQAALGQVPDADSGVPPGGPQLGLARVEGDPGQPVGVTPRRWPPGLPQAAPKGAPSAGRR